MLFARFGYRGTGLGMHSDVRGVACGRVCVCVSANVHVRA